MDNDRTRTNSLNAAPDSTSTDSGTTNDIPLGFLNEGYEIGPEFARGGMGVTTQKFLNRAVFYKVGHHGSHSATARTEGLEKMTSGAPVAIIPVDKATAKTRKTPKTGWAMPFGKLLVAL